MRCASLQPNRYVSDLASRRWLRTGLPGRLRTCISRLRNRWARAWLADDALLTSEPTAPLSPDNRIVHAVWIGARLSLMEQLSIRLLQQHGHEVHLWTYDPIVNVPKGVVVNDAALILPRESIFRYTGMPLGYIPNGGIGSLAHWSDRFQLKLLHQQGGIYLQLDVACLRPLNFKNRYLFVPHIPSEAGYQGIAAFLMKCPKGSVFAGNCAGELQRKINAETIGSLDWDCSMRLMKRALQRTYLLPQRYFLPVRTYVDLGCRKDGPFLTIKSSRRIFS